MALEELWNPLKLQKHTEEKLRLLHNKGNNSHFARIITFPKYSLLDDKKENLPTRSSGERESEVSDQVPQAF